MKRYIYIILGIVVVAALAIAAIFLLKNPTSPLSLFGFGSGGSLPQTGTQGTGQQGNTTGGQGGSSTSTASSSLNTAPQGSLVQTFGVAFDGPALDYFVDPQNNVTAIKSDGTIVSVSGSNSSILATTTITNIIAAKFSFDGKKVLVSSGDSNNPQTNIFDIKNKTWVSAPQGLQSPQWSSSNYQIAYLSQGTSGMFSLSMIDAANLKKAPALLLSLHATDMAMQWIEKNQFVLSDKSTSINNGSVWLFDSQKSTLVPEAYETAGTESTWGSVGTSTLGLLFKSDGKTSTLQLITSSGSPYHTLSFLTLPSKCSFSAGVKISSSSTAPSYLYCGIPTDSNQLSAARLPDDYNMMSFFTSDELVRADVTTGKMDVLWSNSTLSVDATHLKFFNNTLFFISRYDQKLYALTLTPSTAQ